MSVELAQPINPEEIKSQLHLSYSQINTYLICPMKYAHQYVWGTAPETRPAALIFGSAIHHAVEAYYKNLQETGEIIPPEQMISIFNVTLLRQINDTPVHITYKTGEDLESIREMGHQLIRLFHTEVAPQEIKAVEFPFSVSVPDLETGGKLPIRLAGYFDLIECDEEGTYIIGELKTAGQRYSNLKLEYDLQPTVYSYAVSRMKLVQSPEDCLVRYDVLLKTKKPAFERYFVVRTDEDHSRLIHLINQVSRAIEQHIFYRNTGWQCGDCQFKQTCFDKEGT
jgi:putative RecB family exonuclease